MCLIAYVSDGRELDADVYTSAFTENPDGIGIMSRAGVVRFLGKKMLKKAKRYIRTELAPSSVPYAIHFRYATHGAVNLANTHPFVLPDGATYLMHNGVITWCGHDRTRSDTATFTDLLGDHPGVADKAYEDDLSRAIGIGNKLCIMHSDGSFSLVNQDEGLWDKGIWYSNTYSLPDRLNPWAHKVIRFGKLPELPGKPVELRNTRTWLERYDAEAVASRYAPQWWQGTDYDTDLRLLPSRSQRLDFDDGESNLHDGCGLPVPSGYRVKREPSQREYYRQLEAEGLLDASYDDTYAESHVITEADLQDDFDAVLQDMRKAGGM